jgi:hypothetical protein
LEGFSCLLCTGFLPAYRRWSTVGLFLSRFCSPLHVLAAYHPEGEELITHEQAVAIALEGNPSLALKARAEAMAAILSQEGTLPTLSFGALWLPTASGLSLHMVVAIMVGLLLIMWDVGTGSEVMRRLAAPMVGGMASSTLLILIAIPDLCPDERKRHSTGKKETDLSRE